MIIETATELLLFCECDLCRHSTRPRGIEILPGDLYVEVFVRGPVEKFKPAPDPRPMLFRHLKQLFV